MRINQLQIDGFGIFNQRNFKLNQPVTLFYGQNEAGKSTTMGFIRNMLFGFPTRAHLQQRYEPVIGGLHGGFLQLEDETGETLRIERIHGKRDTIYASDGSILNEKEMQQRLGGISQQLFRDLFAFGLSELQEVRTLQSEEMSSYLFHSGMGIHANRIMDAEKKLIGVMETLFKPRGKNQLIIHQLKSLETIDNKLRENRRDIEKYNAHQHSLILINDEIHSVELSIKEKQDQLKWLNLCLKARDTWVRKQEINEELDRLPRFENFPVDAKIRFEKLVEVQENLKIERNRFILKKRKLEEEIQQLKPNTISMNSLPQLELLNEQLGTYENEKSLKHELKFENEQLNERLQNSLLKINENWTANQVRSFSTSVAAREKVLHFKSLLHEFHTEKEKLKVDFEQLTQKIESDKQLIEKIKLFISPLLKKNHHILAHMNMNSAQQLHTMIAEFKMDMNRLQFLDKELHLLETRKMDLLQNINELKMMKKDKKNKSLYWILLSLNIIVPSFLYVYDMTTFALIGFFSMLSIQIAYYFITKNSKSNNSINDSITRSQTSLNELQEEIIQKEQLYTKTKQSCTQFQMKLSAQKEIAISIESTNVDVHQTSEYQEVNELLMIIEQKIKEVEQNDIQIKQTETEIEHLMSGISLLKKSYLEKKDLLDKKQKDIKLLLDKWKHWLSQVELSMDLSPESVLEIFQQVDQAMNVLTNIEKNETKIKRLEEKIEHFEHEVNVFVPFTEGYSIGQALKQMRMEANLQVKKNDDQKNVTLQYEEVVEEIERIQETLKQLDEKKHLLWSEAQASDEKSFLSNVYYNDQRKQLEQELRHTQFSLQDWVGEKQLQKLELELKGNHTIETMTELKNELSAQLTEMQNRLVELRDQKGRTSHQLEKLESDMNHAEHMLAYEGELTKVRELSDQWAIHSFALHLIKKAKAKYEQERQPEVLMKASSYFEKMTNGAFRRVMVPFGEKRMIVERENGAQIETSFLSRGTAELLYLAMRFALAHEFGKKAALPLIMDDIFVNFDGDRLKSTLSVLNDVSNHHQLILFTCHEHIRTAMNDMFPQIQNIDLNLGQS
ncbi:AAA family ATPase [Chengkuizengella sediminis]|uniref:AAA family ATPase n=1 Tax=Chengkuizengella sediminis TaxID=1885917 RepID=UPI00138A4EEB|nr:AAA family ATPase [Chengkuizengella sediminis]